MQCHILEFPKLNFITGIMKSRIVSPKALLKLSKNRIAWHCFVTNNESLNSCNLQLRTYVPYSTS